MLNSKQIQKVLELVLAELEIIEDCLFNENFEVYSKEELLNKQMELEEILVLLDNAIN